MSNSIFQTLKKLGLTSDQTRVLYNKRTRDVEDLKVWKDSLSGVIFIDEFYTGDETYIDGFYRHDIDYGLRITEPDFEAESDAKRRFNSNLKYVSGKKVGDFGCGSGDFLRLVKPHCTEVIGVELQQNYIDASVSYTHLTLPTKA